MKQPIWISFFVAICALTALATQPATAAEPIYTLTVKWKPTGAEPLVTEVPGCNLVDPVIVPIALAEKEPAYWIGEFDFESDRRSVRIELYDPSKRKPAQSGTNPQDFFAAAFSFEWGVETEVMRYPSGSLSFSITPSPENTNLEGDRALPAAEADKLKLKGRYSAAQEKIYADLYNPTTYKIEALHLRITAEKSDDFPGIDRVYKMVIRCDPLCEEDSAAVATLPDLPEGAEYQIKLEKAFGSLAH